MTTEGGPLSSRQTRSKQHQSSTLHHEELNFEGKGKANNEVDLAGSQGDNGSVVENQNKKINGNLKMVIRKHLYWEEDFFGSL